MTNTSKSSRRRSLLSTLVAVIVIIIAAIFSLRGDDEPTEATPAATAIAGVPENVNAVTLQQGFGAQKGFWQVYFTAPSGSRDEADYVGGIDTQLAAAINNTQRSLDIAAFEFNNAVLTQAVLDARARGVTVRIVTDDEHGLEDEDSTIEQFVAADIRVVDDERSALMHNKFMILDGSEVWTGSWNYTVNGTYRNNNNALALRSRRAVEIYQAEFDEMFDEQSFGPRSPENTPTTGFNQDGTPIQVHFAAEGAVVEALIEQIDNADSEIHFMAFSFTLDELRQALETKAAAGVSVQGIFETVGSETQFSELTPLFCDGLAVRQDGNPFILHHKVFVIDGETVITGSFNFSANATDSNDENVVIITDADLAAQYLAEFERRWAEASVPEGLTCS